MPDRVGFIGLGIMGSRMAANLARAGFELTVWNRTASTADEWAARHGAAVASSPQALASNSDVVISMVVDGDQVESVLLGDEGAGQGPGLLCIDMSTIGPAAARRIGARPSGARRVVHGRAGDGLVPEGRGRDADDHGGRRASATSSARGRCSRRWAS